MPVAPLPARTRWCLPLQTAGMGGCAGSLLNRPTNNDTEIRSVYTVHTNSAHSMLHRYRCVQTAHSDNTKHTTFQHTCIPRAPLHWLPISEWIKLKTACMCYNTITGSTPSYISQLLHLYSSSHSLQSFLSDTRLLKLQYFNHNLMAFTLSHSAAPTSGTQSPPRHQVLRLC